MACIIAIEKYKGKYAVILYRDRKTGKYTDPGGGIDLKDEADAAKITSPISKTWLTSFFTACRELKEESLNLFRLNKNNINTISNIINNKSYVVQKRYYGFVAYFESTTGIMSKYYYDNLNLLKKANVPYQWRETDGITRFELKELLNTGIANARGDFKAKDVYGKTQIIDGRAKALIRILFENKLCVLNKGTIELSPKIPKIILTYNKQKKNYPHQSYLNGTHSYYNQ